MKRIYGLFLTLSFVALQISFAQQQTGNYGFGHSPVIEDHEHPEYDTKYNLVERSDKARKVETKFHFPLQVTGTAREMAKYWFFSGYVDSDPGGGISDYNNGDFTYNGHLGTDYAIWPYEWKRVEENQVEVIAAAAGILEDKIDGNPHNHCDWNQPSGWNAVYIRHADGSLGIYGHLKNGTVINKSIGESIEVGEVLGVVASSGRSTGPHLHFEIHDEAGNVIDPFFGPDNTIDESLWVNQEAYMEKAVLDILISSAEFGAQCPVPEELNEEPFYMPGDLVYFTRFYAHHHEPGYDATIEVKQPNGTVEWSFIDQNSQWNSGSWWWHSRVLPSNAPFGMWTVEVTFNGKTVNKQFQVGDLTTDVTEHLSNKAVKVYPIPTSSELFLSSSEFDLSNCNMKIHNLLGEAQNIELISSSASQATIKCKSIPTGNYMLHLFDQNSGKSFARMIIIE